LDTTASIPVEIRARVEATALFDALQTGDYASAARAQERLRSLGWYLSREPVRQKSAARAKSSQHPVGREVPAR
jgi:hypothetical protein